MTSESPIYLYKVLSMEDWEKSQTSKVLSLPKMDSEFIHLSKEDQLESICKKYFGTVSKYMVLKLETSKLKGKLVLEANPGGKNKYYHLYEGNIPFESIVGTKQVENPRKEALELRLAIFKAGVDLFDRKILTKANTKNDNEKIWSEIAKELKLDLSVVYRNHLELFKDVRDKLAYDFIVDKVLSYEKDEKLIKILEKRMKQQHVFEEIEPTSKTAENLSTRPFPSLFAEHNRKKFEAFRKLGLPIGQYCITGGGPLGIRNLREINDIDIVVSADLWEQLAKTYKVIEAKGVTKIVFADIDVEALREGSFGKLEDRNKGRTVLERISRAELIDGLPFESLDDFIYFKRKSGRPKDLRDIEIAESLIKP